MRLVTNRLLASRRKADRVDFLISAPLPHRNSTEICHCTINVELTQPSFINTVATVVLQSFIQPSDCGHRTYSRSFTGNFSMQKAVTRRVTESRALSICTTICSTWVLTHPTYRRNFSIPSTRSILPDSQFFIRKS